uniref:Transmembrane protein 69 n=1 Tax=Fundulus heteroclitus TaxID=8078 RepID=A0A3Q2TZT2_FUNHE
MLSVALRSALSTQRVFLWAHASQRCWTSAPAGASTSLLVDSGHVKPPCFCALPQGRGAFSLIRKHFHSSAVRLKKRAQPEPPPRELDLIRYDMKHLWEGPKPALILGFAGLLPFVSPTLLMAVTETYYPQLAYAQVAYAASIVSFLGGARWGFALPESSPAKPDWINLANSVVPSLLAWATMLMSDSIVPAATMAIMGLGISLHYDLTLLPTYPSWFKALRTVLTFVAFFSLLGTIVINDLYPCKHFF